MALACVVWVALLSTGLGSAAGPWREAAALRIDSQGLPHHRPGSPSQTSSAARLEQAAGALASVAAAGDPPRRVELHGGVDLPAAAQPAPEPPDATHVRLEAASEPAAPRRWHRPSPQGPPGLA